MKEPKCCSRHGSVCPPGIDRARLETAIAECNLNVFLLPVNHNTLNKSTSVGLVIADLGAQHFETGIAGIGSLNAHWKFGVGASRSAANLVKS